MIAAVICSPGIQAIEKQIENNEAINGLFHHVVQLNLTRIKPMRKTSMEEIAGNRM
jgi:hypothetical protein